MTRRRRGAAPLAVLAGWLAAAVSVCGPAAAVAGPSAPTGPSDPSPGSGAGASLSDLRVRDGSLTGLLTLHAAERDPRLLPTTLRLRVTGQADDPSTTVVTPTTAPVTSQRRATVLVVDTSGSMRPADMAAVRRASVAFLAAAPPDVEVGLVAFSGRARVVVPVGRDRTRVRRAVGRLRPSGETALYDAVALATRSLGRSGDRSLVLLGDGGDTRSRTSAAAATRAVRRAGVRTEVIAFRTGDTDTSALARLAAAGGGDVASAGDAGAVLSAFSAAARALDSQVALSADVGTLTGPVTVEVTGETESGPFEAASVISAPRPPTGSAAGAAPVTAAPGDGPGDGAPSGAAGSRPTFQPFPAVLVGGAAAVFAGLAGLVLALLSPMLTSRRRRRLDDVDRLVAGRRDLRTRARPAATPSALGQNVVGLGDRIMQRRSATARTMRLLERADLPWRAGEWLVLRVVAVVVGAAAGMLALSPLPGPLPTLAGAGLGLAGPAVFLRVKAGRRVRRFESQLPDVLTLVASSLQSGFSLTQALDAVATDGADPTAKELSRALAEARIGTDVGEALEHVGERMGSTNMTWTAMAVRIQRQVGGNLAETLRTTAATLREREALLGQVRALSAEGRLSAYILIALPIGVFFWMLWVNPEYLSLLWTRLLGILMLLVGGVMLAVGVVWMRKVVRVEV